MAKHQELTGEWIHVVHRFTFDTLAHMNAGTGYTGDELAAGILKWAWCEENQAFYVLVDDSPITWVVIGNPDAATPADVSTALLKAMFGQRVGVTTNTTVTSLDRGSIFEVESGSVTFAFDSVATLGDGYACAVFNSSASAATLDPDGSETIRDAAGATATKTLEQGEGMILVVNATGFIGLKFRNLSNVTNDAQLKASDLDTDGTMAANSDAKIASQKAIRTYVAAAVAALVNSSPSALDTLKELADALGNDSDFATTVTTALAGKMPLSYLDTDTNLASNSDGKVPSQKAIKAYVDGHTPPTATASVLGVVKVGTGLSIDGSGVLSVATAFLGILLSLTWLSHDNFDEYADGTVTPNLGLSWGAAWGSVTGGALDTERYSSDNFDAYADGATAMGGGTHWDADWGNVTGSYLDAGQHASDNFDSYANGTTSGINAGGASWYAGSEWQATVV